MKEYLEMLERLHSSTEESIEEMQMRDTAYLREYTLLQKKRRILKRTIREFKRLEKMRSIPPMEPEIYVQIANQFTLEEYKQDCKLVAKQMGLYERAMQRTEAVDKKLEEIHTGRICEVEI